MDERQQQFAELCRLYALANQKTQSGNCDKPQHSCESNTDKQRRSKTRNRGSQRHSHTQNRNRKQK